MTSTPLKYRPGLNSEPQTPVNLSKELKQVLNERNLLTAKTRRKVCTMLDNISDANQEIDKRRKYRIQAIQDILNSEKSYLNQLEILMKFFIVPLKERGIIDDAIHTNLFGQIEMIYNLNGELLKELENDLENVANAFLKMAPFLKLYSVYAFDYKNALFILQDLTSKNPVFRKFIQDTESRPEVQTKLNSLMIVPIQRVPRYKLLLEQVLLYSSPADMTFKILKESVKEIESTVSHINAVIEEQEVTQMLLNVQNSLVNRTPNIVKPSRKVIKEGILEKMTRNGAQEKRYCVLMSDIFMYCKILKDRSKNTSVENSLQCCCIFPLKKCKIYEHFPGTFKISCQGDSIILCTSDIQMGRRWVAAIRDAIELHIQCRKTLRKESSKRTPMRKKDLKKFEADFVLSPNKRKSDYESIFRCKHASDDDENTSCFNMRRKTLKRKPAELLNEFEMKAKIRNNLQGKPQNLNSTFKMPGTPPSMQRSKLKTLWSDRKVNKSASSSVTRESNDVNLRSDDHDPTYGFANRFSATKSYYRTHNVDSTIPNSLEQTGSTEIFTDSSPLMDCLYPLRQDSSGSDKSGHSWINKRKVDDSENNYGYSSSCSSTKERKRVKFEDTKSPLDGYLHSSKQTDMRRSVPEKYPFSDVNQLPTNNLSLRERIMGFFARLF